MEIEVTDSREAVVISPRGDLDATSAPEIRQTLQDLLDSGKSRLIVDLAGVLYLDSSGLGELVRAMKRARKAGGDVRLCALSDDVFQVFEMTRLHEQMALYPTLKDAIGSWR